MWVKGHGGKVGNEMADTRAKREVWMGKRMHMPDIVTPAGIRQAYLDSVSLQTSPSGVWFMLRVLGG